jgi:hypothetical protein
MIFLFLLSLLSDNNTLYLMDKSVSLLTVEEEFQFLYSKNGIQMTYGLRDSQNLYELYRIKIRTPLFSRMFFEYNLNNENDYEFKTEEHLFKLLWIPEEKTGIPLSFSVLFSPQSSQNKEYAGIGIGYWKNIKNNHFLNITLQEFEDSFDRLPLNIELSGTLYGDNADLYYKYYKIIPGKKNIFETNEQIGRLESGGMGLTNTIFYRFFSRISPGIRLNYSERDSIFIPISEDTITNKTNIKNLFAEPFIKTKISKKSSFYIGFPMSRKYIKNDTLDYKRKYLGLNFLYIYSFFHFIDLTFGIQKSWRNLNEQKNTETRGIAGLDFKINQTTFISVRQGIELDFPLPGDLKEYDNHTYLLFNHRF